MRKVLLFSSLLFILPLSRCWATPPVSISLSYDLAKGSLHVDALHPSFDLVKSYVRLMLIYVNGDQVSTLNYFKQTDYTDFIDDVPVTAQVGDVIKVDLFCSLGGEMAQEMTVQKPGKDKPDQKAGSGTGNS